MPPELLADVAVRATIPGADPVFTYRVPPALRPLVRQGQLVWAPLRRQRVQGIVLDLYDWKDAPAERRATLGGLPPELRPDPGAPPGEAPTLRDLADVADPEAALTPQQVRLARWLAERCRTSLYDALALMLPPGVAQDSEATWRATGPGMDADLGALPEAERAVLYLLRRRGELPERELRKALRGTDAELRATYAALLERGLVIRGAAITRARARPRLERMARLILPPDRVEAILPEIRSAKQRRALEVLGGVDEGSRQRAAGGDAGSGAEGLGAARGSDEDPVAWAPSSVAVPARWLCDESGADLAALRALERRGLLELTTREVRRDPLAGDATPPDVPPPLTPAQERAVREITAALGGGGLSDPSGVGRTAGHEFLLHGVTGSGKTEVYLRAIGRTLRQGRQALVLVPEIALTAQLVRRFAARFPGTLAVLHSGLGLGERYDEWRRLRSGEAKLAIGSRSAVFAPLPDLGLIIVDEEHEASYKHDGAPRYHARDAARQLAAISGAALVLGSATPSVETYHAAREGRVRLLELPERVGAARSAEGLPRSEALPMPRVQIVDMRRELQQGNRSIFSRPLQEALAGALGRGRQAVLFLNRRGAAAFVMCRDCGHVVACPNCSSPLTVHYDDEGRGQTAEGRAAAPLPAALTPLPSTLLVCHTCGHRELPPAHCPSCWSRRVKSFGIGTQRVVEEVEALFPSARPLRWDRDTAARKGDHQRLLDSFLRAEADVLVGTQMIAKGLDLPLVSVVGVVAADTGLYLPDFRVGERAFQLLTQVAGRAGRRGERGEVVIQTYTPDHYALRAAQEHDYRRFFEEEIAFRHAAGYPPFTRLVRFVYAAPSDDRARRAAEALAAEVRRRAAVLPLGAWSVVGPAPAFFHVQRNRYRWHLLLRAEHPEPLLDALGTPYGWSVDVDPVNVL